MPTAERAPRPRSPSTSTSRSEQPSMTAGVQAALAHLAGDQAAVRLDGARPGQGEEVPGEPAGDVVAGRSSGVRQLDAEFSQARVEVHGLMVARCPWPRRARRDRMPR